MKTTLEIDDQVMVRLEAEAARQGRTISELVEAALRLLLDSKPKAPPPPELPEARMGRPRVDVADRDALYDTMEGI
ncbi:MAG TPA: ribbon-helix-helix protein, CopG family [Planctomycetota bacterium]|nr:ribbon-helix-helix protein, CopG family [Planctomycetota bacterium]